jgi:hypothetical protein
LIDAKPASAKITRAEPAWTAGKKHVRDEPKLRIPLKWVVVDALGALLTGLGVLGLAGSGEPALPILASRAAALALVALGVLLMAIALVRILGRLRDSARRPE